MRWSNAIKALTLMGLGGIGWAQNAATPPQSTAAPDATPVSDDLRDLNAMTFSCPRAALNAAAREAAKAPAQGTYQFAYFKIVTGSHHALYEVHFRSNYEGEPDLKYCVALYCQQGWDPAATTPSVTLMSSKSTSPSDASHTESCAEVPRAHSKHAKSAAKEPAKDAR